MKAKKVITTILLLFVMGSVVYLIVKETGRQKNDTRETSEGPMVDTASPNLGENNVHSDKELEHKVLVYYFHGNMRCLTCRKFEVYAHEALQTTFANELESGKLEWYLVNVDEPSNEHFIQDYGITTRSLVVVDVRNGRQREWKNLQRIWDLVENKREFLRYVREETQAYLEGNI
jgi:hypothetical protein